MKQFSAAVIDNFPVARDTWVMRLDAPAAAEFKPGQFLHLLTADPNQADPLLRRPISILRGGGVRQGGRTDLPPRPPSQFDHPAAASPPPSLVGKGVGGLGPSSRPAPGEVDILLKTVGRGTEWLAARRPGDELEVLGPLGQPFPVVKPGRRLLLVGGGVGIVPLVAAADVVVAEGHEVVLAFGARSAADVPSVDLLHPDVEFRVTTEDGSLGTPGRVTAIVPELLAWADLVFVCGPTPMMRAVTEQVKAVKPPQRPKPTWICLEEHMGCAMGVCLGCVVETKRGYERVCRDGPVFQANDLLW